MNRQRQDVEAGGAAYQAGGSITINQVATAEQMAELMMAMAKQLATFTVESERKVEDRLKDFRESIVEEFTNSPTANTQAFNDPDFQFMLGNAQESFVRNGSQHLKSELTKLVAERSRKQTGSRVAYILNDAIKTVGLLTQDEISALVGLFVITDVGSDTLDKAAMSRLMHEFLDPFIDVMPRDRSPLEYLESNRCLTINHVITRNIDNLFEHKFRGKVPEGYQSKKLVEELADYSPVLRSMIDIWNANSAYQQSTMTALGKAIAHSALAGTGRLNAPLEIWVN